MKKIVSIMFTILLTTMLFAQVKESAGITDSDVKNLAKNFKKIEKLLENADDTDKVNPELEKLGISGPNQIFKVVTIIDCTNTAIQQYTIESNPTLASMYATMGINVADLVAEKNPKDYKLVYDNIELLMKAME